MRLRDSESLLYKYGGIMMLLKEKQSQISIKQEEIKKDIKEGLAQIMCRKGEKWQITT